MGLFDRLRNNDSEEVELRPSQQPDRWRDRRTVDRSSGEVELHDTTRSSRQRSSRSERERSSSRQDSKDDDDGFLLPGMKAAATESSGSSGSSSTTSSGVSRDDRIERLLEQNEQIIQLLEEIARGGQEGWARDRS